MSAYPLPGAAAADGRAFLQGIHGITRRMAVEMGLAVADLIRAVADASPADLTRRISIVEAAVER